MKKLVVLFVLVSLLALGGQAVAELGTIDNVPAATLLLPRFEVDLDSATGTNTLFSVNNASAAPILAHVTVWSDWSVPVVDFDIYLTGYDVQTISMYNVLVGGNLPATGASDTLSNQGAWSDAHINFPGCGITAPTPPAYAQPAISPGFRDHIQAWLTGGVSPITNDCASDDLSAVLGNLARGYITIDAVDECDTAFPGDPGYFNEGGTGIAVNDNVLWGDFFIVDGNNDSAQGYTLVHIEADDAHLGNAQCVPDAETQSFYCRYDPFGGDNREALPSKFATRFLAENDFFTGGTQLLTYRDPGEEGAPYANCVGPTLFTEAAINVFDEEENPFTVVTGGPSGAPPAEQLFPFPRESNRTLVTNQQAAQAYILNTGSFQFGWLYLNLNGAQTGSDVEKNQAYVLTTMSADDRFSVGYDAIQLNNLSGADLGPATLEPAGD